jgi:DNA mismatch endonuclease, patch repair protein
MSPSKPTSEPEQPLRTVGIGGGRRLPYAEPTSAAASAMGRANRRTDTKPETALRSALHRRGLRFRKDHPIRLVGERPIRPDIVFMRQRLAVFVDGCFWHRCPEHCVIPKSNVAYWGPKLEANAERDMHVTQRLQAAGWLVLRIWEHEPVLQAAQRVEGHLRTNDLRTD